jgi:uncharacterized protein
MDQVALCVEAVPLLFDAMKAGDFQLLEKTTEEISQREHEADLLKNEIRNSLRSNLFLPVDRGSLLEVLSIQDSIADKAEDIGAILTLKPLALYPEISSLFDQFLSMNLDCFAAVVVVIGELNELFESSFGGMEGEKVKKAVDEVALLEHKIDLIQHQLLRQLYGTDRDIPYRDFHLWMRVIEEVGMLSNVSEKLANRILMTMELR